MTMSKEWRLAVWLALAASVVLEFAINVFNEHTLWQRMTTLERRVGQLEQRK